MAEIIWGLGSSHVPSIGAALDNRNTDHPYWKPLFDGYRPAREWMSHHQPDVIVLVYNDHANAMPLELVPTFTVGTAARFPIADEGWGRRPVPDVVGHPEFAGHLVESLVDEEFDITVAHQLSVDHGLTIPLSIYCEQPGDAWPCPVIPLLVNVIQYPQPTAHRCLALGEAIGRAVAAYPEELKVAVFGTGGMSHQLAGERAGLINTAHDRMFLDKIEDDPQSLADLTREYYLREAGSEGIEMIMWLIMRGALGKKITRIAETYHVPASNTAAALALFENDGCS